MKELLQLLHQVFTTLLEEQDQLLSPKSDATKVFPLILSNFIRAQMKFWFPTRSPEEMVLYKMLLEMVIKSMLFPSIQRTIDLLSCISLLMPLEGRGKNSEQEYVYQFGFTLCAVLISSEIQNVAIAELLKALIDCQIMHTSKDKESLNYMYGFGS